MTSASIAVSFAKPQGKRSGLWIKTKRIAALGAISLLAACQVVPNGGDVPTQKPVVAGPNIYTGGQHSIALLLPMTGRNGDVGRSIANATKLALADTKNTSLTVTTYDTAVGADTAARMAVRDGNKLILGPLRGDNVVKVANIARPANVPIISFSNDVGVAGRDVFLMGHMPSQSIDRIVKFARSQGMSRFGGIVTKNVYGQRAYSSLNSAVRNSGGTLVGIEEIENSRSSIAAATRRLGNKGKMDAVLISTGGNIALATIPALRRNGMPSARILGTELWNTDGKLAGNKNTYGAWFASVADGRYRTYANKYRQRFGDQPLRLSSLGYDAILLTTRVAQNWRVGSNFPVGRLTKTDGFIGIDGAFRFRTDGLSERMLEVQEVRSGQYVTIDPAPRNFAQ